MKLSVIIPTLNEASSLPRAIAGLPRDVELIVVDGQSRDRTVDTARRLGARVVVGERGRGIQMNSGAAASTGEVLLFLHADCVLGPRAADSIIEVLRDPDVVGGAFRLRIDHQRRIYRVVAFGSNLRARFLGLPYGDQAIFVRRRAFEAVGGYPDIPLMEDVALVRKLRRQGRLVRVDETVTTGTRHWNHLGPIRTTLLNWMTVALFFAGVPPSRLAPVYHRLKAPKSPSLPSQPSRLALPQG